MRLLFSIIVLCFLGSCSFENNKGLHLSEQKNKNTPIIQMDENGEEQVSTILSEQYSLKKNQVQSGEFLVDTANKIKIYVHFGENPIQATITAPDGTIYREPTAIDGWSKTNLIAFYEIEKPVVGKWKMEFTSNEDKLIGVSVAQVGSNSVFFSQVKRQDKSGPPDSDILLGETLYIVGAMKKDSDLVKDIEIKGRITQLNYKKSGASDHINVEKIQLYDDGSHGDKIKNDGVYMVEFTPQKAGTYEVALTAKTKNIQKLTRFSFTVIDTNTQPKILGVTEQNFDIFSQNMQLIFSIETFENGYQSPSYAVLIDEHGKTMDILNTHLFGMWNVNSGETDTQVGKYTFSLWISPKEIAEKGLKGKIFVKKVVTSFEPTNRYQDPQQIIYDKKTLIHFPKPLSKSELQEKLFLIKKSIFELGNTNITNFILKGVEEERSFYDPNYETNLPGGGDKRGPIPKIFKKWYFGILDTKELGVAVNQEYRVLYLTWTEKEKTYDCFELYGIYGDGSMLIDGTCKNHKNRSEYIDIPDYERIMQVTERSQNY